MLTDILWNGAGRAQLLAQLVGTVKIDGMRFTCVVKNDYAVSFEMPGVGDL